MREPIVAPRGRKRRAAVVEREEPKDGSALAQGGRAERETGRPSHQRLIGDAGTRPKGKLNEENVSKAKKLSAR